MNKSGLLSNWLTLLLAKDSNFRKFSTYFNKDKI